MVVIVKKIKSAIAKGIFATAILSISILPYGCNQGMSGTSGSGTGTDAKDRKSVV